MATATSNPAPTTTVTVKIFDMKGLELPSDGFPKRLHKCYVKLELNGSTKQTALSARENTASWLETFYFDTPITSILSLCIYAHRMGGDKLIGSASGSIDSLLKERASGAIIRELSTYDAAGNPTKTQTTVEFSITYTVAPTNAAEAEMKDAISQAQATFEQMKTAPALLDPTQQGIDFVSPIVTNVQTLANAWDPLLKRLDIFVKIVDGIAEIHPYSKMAWRILSATYKVIKDQKDSDDNVNNLLAVITGVYAFVEEAEPLKNVESHNQILAAMAQQTTECAYFIRDYYTNASFWKRTIKNIASDIKSKIKQYEDKFTELKAVFEGDAVLQTELMVMRILDVVKTITQDFDLNDIPYARGARYDPAKGCLPGTREVILEEITEWINKPNGDGVPRIFFLSGVAGSGKSAIAHTIASRFYQLRRLGSSFCFDRSYQAQRRPDTLFSTMTQDIAGLDPHWKASLCSVVKGDRALRTTTAIGEQFANFILKPSKALTTSGPIVIVIDALDESGDQDARSFLLDIIAKRMQDLPSNFRILLTSRPELDIYQALKGKQHVCCKHMDSIGQKETNADISLYIQDQLHDVSGLDEEWPNKGWLPLLIKSSDGLFQWAFTACRAIKIQGILRPAERLKHFVSFANGLDGIYTEVLKQAIDVNSPKEMFYFQLIMGRILAVKKPLTAASLAALRSDGEEADLVELVVQPLASLLSGAIQKDTPVQPLHTSFHDFLTDKERSGSFYVDVTLQHKHLALACWKVMDAELQFNICHLETSYLKNCSIPGLDSLVAKYISPHLYYACHFWDSHAEVISPELEILDMLRGFFYKHFLSWLEVLSLTGGLAKASVALQTSMEWMKDHNKELVEFAYDAKRFISMFGTPIVQSAPHIYLSALPFAPAESRVSKKYLSGFKNLIAIKHGRMLSWPAIINVLEGHISAVFCVAFSPDGKYIVSGSLDNTIRVWDAYTGQVVSGPFYEHHPVYSVAFSPNGRHIVSGTRDKEIRVWDIQTGQVVFGLFQGHTNSVGSVAFSPDGRYIVSGSEDRTIRVWDAHTGQVVSGPFQGHTGSVYSVAFSPDGKHIVSGSSDNTIRVWDVYTSQVVSGPFKGHTHPVNSVAFSPDGKQIVSGSWDHTIRVWDVYTGQVVSGPFQGHTDSVDSIAFSPDGRHIVSGSTDNTIRVWNAHTGQVASGPFKGHTDSVNSVAFSPDGKHIVSGSWDSTIRVWDAHTGQVVSSPFQAHTSDVNSVAFCPNGKHIVSGSNDNTIRIWDAHTGQAISSPFHEHTDDVFSVAFSCDGKHIVSGSRDKTIRVWDAHTGQVVSGPFQGHTDSVYSVAFSPDGKYIVSGSGDKTVMVWNAHTGQVVSSPFRGHTDDVFSVAFSPSGKKVVSGSRDKTIRVWDVCSSQVVSGPFQGHTSSVNSVTFSPDGRHIVSGSWDKTVRVWDAYTGQVVSGPFQGHTNSVDSIALSPDGKRIVSGSRDHTIRVWDAYTGQVMSGPFEGHTNNINSVAFSNDGMYIVSGSRDGTIRVWDVHTDQVVSGSFKGHTGSVNSVAFSPDGKQIVSGSLDSTIRVWNAHTGQVVSGSFQGHTGPVNSVVFSPDGKYIVSGSWDHTIRVWDVNTGQVVSGPFQGHTNSVGSVAFSPDGKYIVSGSTDNTIRLWDAHTGQVATGLFQGHTDSVKFVTFSPDGKYIVSGSGDQTIRVWDAHTGQAISSLLQGHTSDVNSVAFSPDGKCIVSGSSDNTIRVWDAHTGQAVSGPYHEHTGDVFSVAFSHDGKHIVSGSRDKTIKVWDAHTGQVVSGPFQGHTGSVYSVAFSPDGKHIVSGSSDKTIRVWDAHTGKFLSNPFERHNWIVLLDELSANNRYTASETVSPLVRVWDARLCQAVPTPLEEYIRNSLQLIFGSSNTLWDRRTTEALTWLSNFATTDHAPIPFAIQTYPCDDSSMTQGWMLGNNSELLFWVPPDCRAGLWRPRNTLIVGQNVTILDFSKFAYGRFWQQCCAPQPL